MKVTRKKVRAIALALAATILVPAAGAVAAPPEPSDQLTVHQGKFYANKPGQVVEGLEIRGQLIVQADNVTIRNSRIVGSEPFTKTESLVAINRGTSGVRIIDTEIKAAFPNEFVDGIHGKGFTAERLDISNVVDGIKVIGSDVTIRDSSIHGLRKFPTTSQADGYTHNDAVQVEGGSNIVIADNRFTITTGENAAVMVTQNAGTVSNLTIRDNLLEGGGCTVNVDEKGKGKFIDMTIERNAFGKSNWHPCAMKLPKTSPITVTGNYYTAAAGGGAAVVQWHP